MGKVCHNFSTFPPAVLLSGSLFFHFCLGVIIKRIRLFQQKSLQVQEFVEDDCVCQALSHMSLVISMSSFLKLSSPQSLAFTSPSVSNLSFKILRVSSLFMTSTTGLSGDSLGECFSVFCSSTSPEPEVQQSQCIYNQ